MKKKDFRNIFAECRHKCNVCRGMQSFAAIIEQNASLYQLEKMVGDLPEEEELSAKHLKPLVDFLATRWSYIQDTEMAYCLTPHLTITQVCLDMVKKIAEAIKHPCYYQLLMPSLSVTQQEITGICINDLKLHEFILSDDGLNFLPIMSCLDFACDDGQLKKPYLVNGHVEKLSTQEGYQISNHSREANKYYEAVVHLARYRKSQNSFGGALHCLMLRLNEGGVKPQSLGGGTEYSSGASANEGIAMFGQLLEKLSNDQKLQLFSLTATEINRGHIIVDVERNLSVNDDVRNFGDIWKRLSDPVNTNNPEGQTAAYCVELLAQKIEAILERHPELYDLEIIQLSANEVKGFFFDFQGKANDCRENLNRAITSNNYHITILLKSTFNFTPPAWMLECYINTLSDYKPLLEVVKFGTDDILEVVFKSPKIKNLITKKEQVIDLLYSLDFGEKRFKLVKLVDPVILANMFTTCSALAHVLVLIPRELRFEALNFFSPCLANLIRNQRDIANIMFALSDDILKKPIDNREKLKLAINKIETKYKTLIRPETLKELMIGVTQVYRDDLLAIGFFGRKKEQKIADANCLIQLLENGSVVPGNFKQGSTLGKIATVMKFS